MLPALRFVRSGDTIPPDIDFEHACVAHALKFRWNNEGTCILSPERGMVSTETAEE